MPRPRSTTSLVVLALLGWAWGCDGTTSVNDDGGVGDDASADSAGLGPDLGGGDDASPGEDGAEPGTDASPMVGPADRILYSRQDGTTNRLYTAALDGSDERALTSADVDSRDGRWSPDGQQIVYHSRIDHSTTFAIWIIDADGQNAQAIIPTDAYKEAGSPRWSPDGTRIAFHAVQTQANSWDVLTIKSDGTDARQVVGTKAAEASPAWSPDGKTLVYHRLTELWLVGADGSNPHKLAGPHDDLFTPSPIWSRATNLIAFSIGDFEANIHVINPDGSGARQLTTAEGGEYQPSFSADGTQLAIYHFADQANSGVYTVDLQTGALTPLVPKAESPAFRP